VARYKKGNSRLSPQIGMGSPIKIGRGLNALWIEGGLQCAPPRK
jgi:hypothetical protein